MQHVHMNSYTNVRHLPVRGGTSKYLLPLSPFRTLIIRGGNADVVVKTVFLTHAHALCDPSSSSPSHYHIPDGYSPWAAMVVDNAHHCPYRPQLVSPGISDPCASDASSLLFATMVAPAFGRTSHRALGVGCDVNAPLSPSPLAGISPGGCFVSRHHNGFRTVANASCRSSGEGCGWCSSSP